MHDRDQKIRKLLSDLRDGERIPPFENLWSLAEKKRMQPESGRHGTWRWALGPAVSAGVIALLLVFIVQVDRPVTPSERRVSTLNGGELLASLDDLDLPALPLDSILREPRWLSEDDLDTNTTDTDEDDELVVSLVLGDTPYAGATEFLLQRDISTWDEPSERNVP